MLSLSRCIYIILQISIREKLAEMGYKHKPVFNIIAGDSSATAARVRCSSPRLASRNRTFQPPSTPSTLGTLLTATGERFTVLLINWVQPNFSRFWISVLLRFIVIFMAHFLCSMNLMVLMLYSRYSSSIVCNFHALRWLQSNSLVLSY